MQSSFVKKCLWYLAAITLFVSGDPCRVFAETLFAVVSDRSSASLAAGADYFVAHHPGHKLVFRSTSQFDLMSDSEIRELMDRADAILTGGVFGDTAVRLQSFLVTNTGKPVLAVSSAQTLEVLSHDRNGLIFAGLSGEAMKRVGRPSREDETLIDWIGALKREFPRQETWLRAKGYWQARGPENVASLIALSLQVSGADLEPGAMKPRDKIRFYQEKELRTLAQIRLEPKRPWVAVFDHDTGDDKGNIDLVDRLCESAKRKSLDCLGVFAHWGESSVQALRDLKRLSVRAPLAAVVALQDFVIGGGEGREAATRLLAELNVPVLKGIRIADRSREQWMLSDDGLPWNSIHYRISMPELQGISQPLILASESKFWMHPLTGMRLSITEPHPDQAERMIERIAGWYRLREIPNSKKRVAIIYYNHPPGRHNIGADNLDVPASLWNILTNMKKKGYATGELPADQAALLELIQQRGVNLPEQADTLKLMAEAVATLTPAEYGSWFRRLPSPLQAEMEQGPLGFLHETLRSALSAGERGLAEKLLQRVIGDIRFVLEGAVHPARDRARSLVSQLEAEYEKLLDGKGDWDKAEALNRAARETQIEGLRGWGPAPGTVMVQGDKILVPGLRFENVFIGPQPPRGWELNEELLHANTTFPPHPSVHGVLFLDSPCV